MLAGGPAARGVIRHVGLLHIEEHRQEGTAIGWICGLLERAVVLEADAIVVRLEGQARDRLTFRRQGRKVEPNVPLTCGQLYWQVIEEKLRALGGAEAREESRFLAEYRHRQYQIRVLPPADAQLRIKITSDYRKS